MSRASFVAVGFVIGTLGLAATAQGQGTPSAQGQAGTTSTAPAGEGLTVAQCTAGYAPSYGLSRAQFDTFCQAQLGGSAPTSGAASGAITGPGVGSSTHSGASGAPAQKK
jgi:hypothetical protein